MADPKFGKVAADMFVAGNSTKGKEIAIRLAKDIGLAECYDLGGDHRVEMLQQLAMIWVNLALFQKQGRNIAFKVLRKDKKNKLIRKIYITKIKEINYEDWNSRYRYGWTDNCWKAC